MCPHGRYGSKSGRRRCTTCPVGRTSAAGVVRSAACAQACALGDQSCCPAGWWTDLSSGWSVGTTTGTNDGLLRSVQVLAMDHSLICATNGTADATREVFVVLAVVVLLGFCVLAPTVLFVVLWKKIDAISDEKHADHELVMAKYSYLVLGFKRNQALWEFLIMLRKLVIVSISIFLRHYTYEQTFLGLLVVILSLLLHTRYNPYQSVSDNRAEYVSLSVISFTLFAGIALSLAVTLSTALANALTVAFSCTGFSGKR